MAQGWSSNWQRKQKLSTQMKINSRYSEDKDIWNIWVKSVTNKWVHTLSNWKMEVRRYSLLVIGNPALVMASWWHGYAVSHFPCISNLSILFLLFCQVKHNFKMTSMENSTEVNEFGLLGLTDTPELQVPFFIIFTLIHIITVMRNLGIIMLILLDFSSTLPWICFLSNLSLVDCAYSSAVTPKAMGIQLSPMGDVLLKCFSLWLLPVQTGSH